MKTNWEARRKRWKEYNDAQKFTNPMKKFIVIWKPKFGGKVSFRVEVEAENQLDAVAEVARRNGSPIAEVVSVTEHTTDLWTPFAAGFAELVESMEAK